VLVVTLVQRAAASGSCDRARLPMRALPLPLAAAAATSFLELLPEPSMVCDNSKCRLEGEEPCLREYAVDRRCSTFGAPYVALDDALAACARHNRRGTANCSGVYDARCDRRPAENCREDYCTSWGDDCCASMDWGEPATCSNGYVPVPANSSRENCHYECCPADSNNRSGFFMCDANEALADHPASSLHDTRGCVVTCAAWNVSDCTSPTYVGAVADRRCEETVRLDKIGAGRYERFDHHHHWWHGGNRTMDFMDCIAAVRAHAGQDGCRGEYFYWEDWMGWGGECRCVTGNCTLGRREWDWPLFSLGCPGAAEEREKSEPPREGETCRSDICTDYANDCCAPGGRPRGCRAAGYEVRTGGTSLWEPCLDYHGQEAIYQCCEPGTVEPYDFEGCPAGYYTCAGCYDQDADCACDDACDLGAHEDCSHHDCCDFNVDCECVRVRHGSGDEYCWPGPTGSDGALPNFECSVRKHGEEASGDEVVLEDRWKDDAGRCCAGPNETATCADGYTVVAGDAPCVFTCCEGAVDNLTTAADVDAEGFCWEAHANEGRRPPEWHDCCNKNNTCPGREQKVYLPRETYKTHCCPRASSPAACFEPKRRADCVDDACRTSDIRRRHRYRDRLTPMSAQVQARRPGHTGRSSPTSLGRPELQGRVPHMALVGRTSGLVGSRAAPAARGAVLRRQPHAGGRGLCRRRWHLLHEQEFRRCEMRRAGARLLPPQRSSAVRYPPEVLWGRAESARRA